MCASLVSGGNGVAAGAAKCVARRGPDADIAIGANLQAELNPRLVHARYARSHAVTRDDARMVVCVPRKWHHWCNCIPCTLS